MQVLQKHSYIYQTIQTSPFVERRNRTDQTNTSTNEGKPKTIGPKKKIKDIQTSKFKYFGRTKYITRHLP